jgi:hypothetical protein
MPPWWRILNLKTTLLLDGFKSLVASSLLVGASHVLSWDMAAKSSNDHDEGSTFYDAVLAL